MSAYCKYIKMKSEPTLALTIIPNIIIYITSIQSAAIQKSHPAGVSGTRANAWRKRIHNFRDGLISAAITWLNKLSICVQCLYSICAFIEHCCQSLQRGVHLISGGHDVLLTWKPKTVGTSSRYFRRNAVDDIINCLGQRLYRLTKASVAAPPCITLIKWSHVTYMS